MPLIAQGWSQMKIDLEHIVGFSSDALHVHVGMLVFIACNYLLRGRTSILIPWLFLLGVELTNEALDMSRPPGSFENDLGSSVHDLVNTMLVPTAMVLFWRHPPKSRDIDADVSTIPGPDANSLRQSLHGRWNDG